MRRLMHKRLVPMLKTNDVDYSKLLRLTASAFIITLTCGGEPVERRDGTVKIIPFGDARDRRFASGVIGIFANRLLAHQYGRYWLKRTDIWYSFAAFPEMKARDGLTTKQLHYHCLFDGAGMDQVRGREFADIVTYEWAEAAIRKFRHVPERNIQRVADPIASTRYAQKFCDADNFEYAVFRSDQLRQQHI